MTDVSLPASYALPLENSPATQLSLVSEALHAATFTVPPETKSAPHVGKSRALEACFDCSPGKETDQKMVSAKLGPDYVDATGRINYDAFFHNGVNNYSAEHMKPAGPAPTMLESTIDMATSHVVSDNETRKQVNHYSAEFLKTASLFARPKVGVASAVVLYGMDNVHTDQDLMNGSIDFAIGGAKGATIRKLFDASAKTFNFAPTKGVAMGMISRSAEVVFDRDMVMNPELQIRRLKAETLNPTLVAFDAATFVVGEGLFGVANKATGNALKRSPLLGGMAMGGSFGIVNGGSGEIIRQQEAGEDFDLNKVLKHAALDGGVGALGAGFGVKASDPAFYRGIGNRVSNIGETANSVMISSGLRTQPGLREFVVTGERTSIEKFVRNETSEATATVREVKKVLFFDKKGPEQNLFISHKAPDANANGIKLVPGKSIIANCYPERMSPQMRLMHAFPEATGPVWLDAGSNGRMRLLAENTYKAEPGTYKPLGTMVKLGRPQVTMNVMAPLSVGNMENPNDPNGKAEWEAFDRDLANAKKVGVDGVSTDVWWGLIEPKPGEFNWKYYDRVAERIKDHGLKWVPILALHQCGGNVGDNVYVPLPFWIWGHLANKAGSSNPDYAKYVSEQGNKSNEYVSAWATPLAIPRFKMVMEAFQARYANHRGDIAEVNVSLGPAGEIRYPSYNSHDQNSGYPTRGALQSYSEVAVKSFQDFAVKKYGSLEKVKEAWGPEFGENIAPPKDPNQFFGENKHHNTQYGKDYFDWYNQSLIDHGRQILNTAMDVFGAKDAPFSGIDIGAKIPGVHWRVGERQGDQIVVGDRLAELTAGLIRTSRNDWGSDELGRGYRPMLEMFRDVQRPESASKVVPHFTALEMADGHEGPGVKSLPYALATWVGQEAVRNGLTLKGENALSWNLHDHASWDRMRSFVSLPGNQNGYYHGLTLLRMSDVLNSDVGRNRLTEMIQAIKASQPPAEAK